MQADLQVSRAFTKGKKDKNNGENLEQKIILQFMEKVKKFTSQGWKNILKIIIPYLVVVVIFQITGTFLAGIPLIHMMDFQQTPAQSFIINLMSMIGTVGIVWFFTTKVDKKTFKSIGFERISVCKDISLGLIIGFVIMLFGFSILIFTKQLLFAGIKPNLPDLLLSIGLFVFIAITEEVLLRGYILRNLMVSFNKYAALVISAVIFSLMHLANPDVSIISLSIIFLSGLVLGLPYLFTKNLWFPIALHFSWNFFQGPIFGYNVSGMNFYKLIETRYETANIWNGGKFGFEGSVIAILFLMAALTLEYILFRNRKTAGLPKEQQMETELADEGI